jgi:hypothetical protein
MTWSGRASDDTGAGDTKSATVVGVGEPSAGTAGSMVALPAFAGTSTSAFDIHTAKLSERNLHRASAASANKYGLGPRRRAGEVLRSMIDDASIYVHD